MQKDYDSTHTHMIYGQCIVCGEEDTWYLSNDEYETYREAVSNDADLDDYKEIFPSLTEAQRAFLWAGLCPKHSH